MIVMLHYICVKMLLNTNNASHLPVDFDYSWTWQFFDVDNTAPEGSGERARSWRSLQQRERGKMSWKMKWVRNTLVSEDSMYRSRYRSIHGLLLKRNLCK